MLGFYQKTLVASGQKQRSLNKTLVVCVVVVVGGDGGGGGGEEGREGGREEEGRTRGIYSFLGLAPLKPKN